MKNEVLYFTSFMVLMCHTYKTLYLFVFIVIYLKNKLDMRVTREIKYLKMYNVIQVYIYICNLCRI